MVTKENVLSMKTILDGVHVSTLISHKLPLSDDLLILCSIYTEYCNMSEYFNLLINTIIECLNGNNDNFKTRNYQWFKHYLPKSNVMLVGCNSNSNNSKDSEDNILFDNVLVEVNKLLLNQKQFIWDNVKKIQKQKEKNEIFQKLCKIRLETKKTKRRKRITQNTNKTETR